MAKINKQEVLQEIQEGLRLDTAREQTPNELAEKVLPVYIANPRARIIQFEDTALNNSSKVVTVPAGKKWKIFYMFVSLITTATAGSRQLRLQVRDQNNNELMRQLALNVQIASTTEFYNFGQFADIVETIAGVHNIPIPVNFILIENFDMVIEDVNAIAGGADDLAIRIMIEETDMQPNR